MNANKGEDPNDGARDQLNYAGNNPRWARLLPLVNAHL